MTFLTSVGDRNITTNESVLAGGVVVYDKILSKDKTPGGIGDVIIINDNYDAGSSSYSGSVTNSAVFQTGHVQLTQDVGSDVYGQINYNTGSLGSDFTFEADIEFKDSAGSDGAEIFLYYGSVDPATNPTFTSTTVTGFAVQVQTNSNIIALRENGVTISTLGVDPYVKDTIYTVKWVVTGGNTHNIYLDDVLKLTHVAAVSSFQYSGVGGRTPTTFSTEYRVYDFNVTQQGVAEEKKCVIEFPQASDIDPHLRIGFGTEESLKVNREGEISIPKQLIRSYRQITASETLTEDDYRVGCAHSSAITVTLPLINDLTTEGKLCELTIFDESGNASTNNITIQCSGANTLNGQSSLVITGNYNSYSVFSAGNGQWFLA